MATVKCEHCGAEVVIQPKKTTRSFNIAFNKLVRQHDWRCEHNAKVKAAQDNVDKAVADIMKKITQGETC